MKTIKIFLTAIALICSAFIQSSFAQNKETIKIKTSAECGMCKKTIEKELSYVKGVKKAKLDVASKEVTVVYNPKKTSPEKIKEAITKAGYNADEMKANNKAYDKLPECCKKGGM